MTQKLECKLINEDGNIFFILSRVRNTLRENGLEAELEEVTTRVMESKSYYEALEIISEYVDPV